LWATVGVDVEFENTNRVIRMVIVLSKIYELISCPSRNSFITIKLDAICNSNYAKTLQVLSNIEYFAMVLLIIHDVVINSK
jgi:hypothetical protein